MFALAASLAGCSGGQVEPIVIDLSGATASQAPASEPPSRISMRLADKVGQMFVVPAQGVFLNEQSAAFLALKHQVVDNGVGGIIFSRSQVYGASLLVGRLQKLARQPILFSADLEAGSGMRFDDATYGPWAMAIAATGDPSLAEKRARATAEEARAMGILQVFAPVADVNVNPDNPVINVRSFGEDPVDVARYVAATVKGLESGGVLATLKHFPGHGDVAVDSHRALPVLGVDRAHLDAVELLPFREGIKAGASAVMVAHLAVPALDPAPAPPLREQPKDVPYGTPASEIEQNGTTPASLSAPIVADLLRKQLGFKGLVVTDAMTMGGLVAHFEPGEAAIRAILAGDDMILMSPDTDAAVKAVLDAVKSGRIKERRIDESVDRILNAKKKLKLSELSTSLTTIATVVGSPAHDALEAEIARRSLTLVREGSGALPLKAGGRLLSVVVSDEAGLNGPAAALGAELNKRVPAVVTLRLDPRSNPDEVKAAVDAAKDADVVLLSLFVRARSGQGKIAVPDPARAAIPQLLASGKPVVAVAFGSPYLIRDFPDLPTYLCAWGTQDIVQTASARALFGEAPIEGHLPVTIPGIAKRGDGLTKAVAPQVTK